MSKSEFGEGFLYPLILFAQHFNDDFTQKIGQMGFLLSMDEETRNKVLAPNPEPQYNYGKDMDWGIFWWKQLKNIYPTPEESLSSWIGLWASGACDHLFGLNVPKRYKGTKIGTLANKIKKNGLQMRNHYAFEKVWSIKDIEDLKSWTNQLFFELDKENGDKPAKATWQ